MTTHDVGDRAEAKIMAALIEEYAVLIPFGNGKRYDMVIERDGEFFTVQCKNGRLRSGCLEWNAVSSGPRSKSRTYDDLDYFGVYSPELDTVYLVPISETPHTSKAYLRVEPTQRMSEDTRWARDYQI